MKASLRRALSLVVLLSLAACGSGMACNNEFGAPPERALWCGDMDNFLKTVFTVPPPRPVEPERVKCVETLGDRMCQLITAN
jgi:hypothetical protein